LSVYRCEENSRRDTAKFEKKSKKQGETSEIANLSRWWHSDLPWRVSSRYRGAKEESNTCCIRQWFLFRHENFEYWGTPRYWAKLFFFLLEETYIGRFILLSKLKSKLYVAILNFESNYLKNYFIFIFEICIYLHISSIILYTGWPRTLRPKFEIL